MLIARLPKDRTFEVLECDRGEKAVEEYQKARPDFVLLDLTMPGMSGYEVLEKLRALDPTARVVVISADVQDQARQRVIAIGALAYVPKPVNTEDVAAIFKAYA